MAERLGITVTEQDFITYSNFYQWDEFSVTNFRYYDKHYLPKNFVKAVLDLFATKTRLDGTPEEYVNYMISKNMLNSVYGMSVTNPVRDEIEYTDGEYIKTKADLEKAIDTYNKAKRRFLFYPWGVWIAAYARRNLFTGIEAVGDDFVYSDTDSIKLLNPDSHRSYFDAYNLRVTSKISLAAQYHHIDESEFSPLNPKGKAKTLGIWDYEGIYLDFKTLGAKRYMYRDDSGHHLTLAGANKKMTMKYLEQTGDPFENFNDDLRIPPDYAGRLTLTYIDNPTSGVLVDCNGVPYRYEEKSCVHMEKSEYNLTMSDDFLNYLKGVQDLE